MDRTVFFRRQEVYDVRELPDGTFEGFNRLDEAAGTCPTDPGAPVCPTGARAAVPGFGAGFVSLELDFSDGAEHWPLDADFYDVEVEFDAMGEIVAWDLFAQNVAYLSFVTSERGDESGEARRGPELLPLLHRQARRLAGAARWAPVAPKGRAAARSRPCRFPRDSP